MKKCHLGSIIHLMNMLSPKKARLLTHHIIRPLVPMQEGLKRMGKTQTVKFSIGRYKS